MGKFDDIAKETKTAMDLTDEHIKDYINPLFERNGDAEYDPTIIEKFLQGLTMPNHIADANARVTHYCVDFFELLESVGSGSFREHNQKKMVSLIINGIQPSALKREICKHVAFDEKLAKNVKKFIGTLICEAINFQI